MFLLVKKTKQTKNKTNKNKQKFPISVSSSNKSPLQSFLNLITLIICYNQLRKVKLGVLEIFSSLFIKY